MIGGRLDARGQDLTFEVWLGAVRCTSNTCIVAARSPTAQEAVERVLQTHCGCTTRTNSRSKAAIGYSGAWPQAPNASEQQLDLRPRSAGPVAAVRR